MFNAGTARLADFLLLLEATPVEMRNKVMEEYTDVTVFGPLAYQEPAEPESTSPSLEGQERVGYFGNIIVKDFAEVGLQVLRTADGKRAFVSNLRNSNMVPAQIDPLSLTLEQCEELLEEAREIKKRFFGDDMEEQMH
jgi:hypothetical protein